MMKTNERRRRYLVISDLHAHPWSAFAKGEGGGNTRLNQTLKVLEASLAHAQEEEIPWLFAGDIVHTAGYALNVVLAGLVEVFNRYRDVEKYANWGNHDARGVGGRIYRHQTIFSSLVSAVPNLNLLDFPEGSDEVITLPCGTTLWGAGYQPKADLLDYGPGAEIGIFHQTVRGSETADGFALEGIPADELLKRYRVSIVGHVHHPQQIDAPEGRAILIPGSPEHHRFSDAGDRGWWILELPEDPTVNPSVEFFESGSPKFITVDSPSKVEDDGNFYRVRYVGAGDKLPDHATAIAPEPTVVKQRDILKDADGSEETLQAWMAHDPPEPPSDEELQEKWSEARYLSTGLELLQAQDPTRLRPARLREIYMKNFLSYEDQPWKVPEGVHLLLGEGRDYPSNGAGKTSLAGEALYWLLFDKNTKGLASDEIVRWGTDEVEVRGWFDEPDGTTLEVARGRKSGSPWMTVEANGVPWEASGVREMTQKLSDYLGLTPTIFQNLSYFSQEKVLLFSSATDGERKNVLADLIGLTAYQQASSMANEKAKQHARKADQARARIEDQKESLATENELLTNASRNSTEWQTNQRTRISDLKTEIADLKEKVEVPEERARLARIRERADDLITRFDRKQDEEFEARAEQRERAVNEQYRKAIERVVQNRKELSGALVASFRSIEQARKMVASLAELAEKREKVEAAKQKAAQAEQAAREELASMRASLRHLGAQNDKLSRERVEIGELVSQGICPTCEQEISDEHGQDCIQAVELKQTELQRTIDELKVQFKEQEGAADQWGEEKLAQRKKLEQIDALASDLGAARQKLDKIQETVREEEQIRERMKSAGQLARSELRQEFDKARVQYVGRKTQLVGKAETFVREKQAKHEQALAAKESELQGLESAADPYASEIQSREGQIQAITEKLEKTTDAKREALLDEAVYEYWRKGFSKQGIQSLLVEQIATLFNKNRGDIFPILTEGVYDVQLSTLSETKAGELREKTDFIVHMHGKEIPYASTSGGQRRRIDIGIMLVLVQSVSEWMQVPGILGILVLDEVFGFMDGAGPECLVDVLEEIQKTIPTVLTITQDTHLQSIFPETIQVKQDERGVSRVVS